MHHCALDAAVLLDTDLESSGLGDTKPFPGEHVRSIAARSIRRSFLKKFHNFERLDSADKAALDLFLSFNEKCSGWVYPSYAWNADSDAVEIARNMLYDLTYNPYGSRRPELCTLPTLSELYAGFDVGPGSSIGTKWQDFYSKFATSNLASSSPVLHQWYDAAISPFGLHCDVEDFRNDYAGRAIVSGSRLSFVPKTTEISRVICTEPVLNMMFQKGVSKFLLQLLESRFGINLETQPDRNKELARIGSITGQFSTIDLSSASDSISIKFLRNFAPAELVHLLEACRCKATILPDGSPMELHMISSMGNAFTFPLQTLIFALLLQGSYLVCGLTPIRVGGSQDNWGVFGDDIVCDTRVYPTLCRVLTACGFVVNEAKSFSTGDFRESCGADYVRGHDVRGVYCKSLRDRCDYYSLINRLNKWSAKHSIPLPNVVRYLRRQVPFLPVPFDESDDAGIKCDVTFAPKKVDGNGAIMYSLYKPKDKFVRVLDEPQFGTPLQVVNPAGILLAAIAGRLRDGLISIRQYKRKVVKIRRRTPRWDYVPPYQYGSIGEEALISLTRANLVS